MALMKCPECNKEISDKAIACPGCGFPIVKDGSNQGQSNEELIAQNCYNKFPFDKVKGIKEFHDISGRGLRESKEMMDIFYNSSEFELLNKKTQEKIEIRREVKKIRKEEVAEMRRNGIAMCPKCHSTSISYDTKKLSIGRAIVGDAIAGAPGAVLGGLSSKKGYGVCLNCGKRWKI